MSDADRSGSAPDTVASGRSVPPSTVAPEMASGVEFAGAGLGGPGVALTTTPIETVTRSISGGNLVRRL